MTSYISRDPVLSEVGFVGRAAELNWVKGMLERPSPQNCNIIGEPRSGKTSFLAQVAMGKIGSTAGGACLHIWLRLAELPEHSARSFWFGLGARLHLVAKQAGYQLEEAEIVLEDARDLFDELDETLEFLFEEANCPRVLIIIDDFDLLMRGIGSRDLDWLRALATRFAGNLAFVISSSDSLVQLSERVLAREDLTSNVSPFANMFHNRSLALLTREEAAQLCRETAVAEQQPALTDSDISFLIAEAGRQPALLKIVCSYFFEGRQYEAGGEQLYEDVRGDMRLDEHVNWLCRQLWQRRSLEERQYLAAIAQGQVEERDVIVHNRLKKHLGLIENREDNLTIFSDAFAFWIQRDLKRSAANGEAASDRRKTAEPSDELTYYPEQRMVYLEDREVHLTSLEGRLLTYFIEHKNEVCSIDELLENVWGPGKTRSVVEKAVNRLRIKIEHDPKRPRFILSARGEGYLFRLE